MNFTTIKQKIKKILIWSQKYTKTDMVYLVKNSFWTGIGKLFSSLSGLIILIIMTRYLTKETVGQYNFFLSILAIVAIFSIPGLNTSTVEAVAKDNDGVYKRAVRSSFIWSWLGSITLIFISLFFYFIKNDHILSTGLLLSALLLPFQYAPNTWRSFLIAKQKFRELNIYSSIQSIVYLITMIGTTILSKGNLVLLILAYLLIQAISNIFSYILTQKYIKNDLVNTDWKQYGFFLTKMHVLNLITNNIDKIMIGIFMNMQSLAVYSVGKKIITSLQGVIKEFFNIFIPKIAKREKINFKKYFHLTLLSTLFSLLLIILIPYLIRSLFPAEYQSSILITQLFLVFLPIWILDLLLSYETNYNLKNKKIIFYKNIITPIIYFILMIPTVFFFKEIGLVLIVSLKSIINIIIFKLLYQRQ